jgi:hypothetical protein
MVDRRKWRNSEQKIKGMETLRQIQRIKERKNLFFDTTNNIDKPLTILSQRKEDPN